MGQGPHATVRAMYRSRGVRVRGRLARARLRSPSRIPRRRATPPTSRGPTSRHRLPRGRHPRPPLLGRPSPALRAPAPPLAPARSALSHKFATNCHKTANSSGQRFQRARRCVLMPTGDALRQETPTMTRVITHVRSNVVAYLALFVALGGTSYAAVSIPNHSVTPVKFDSKLLGGYVRGWVHVSATGRLLASGGRWQASMDPHSPGHYEIQWSGLPKTACTSAVSADIPPTVSPTPGYAVASTFSFRRHVVTAVYTYNAVGQQSPMSFD